ncbi:CBU_0592 family membrane protein [Maribacter dokdonensis]|uniref:CBU_0592 family membrane protein n=1 Tax=Maribacter dokdonensis TaxID=320912 RepID=UPI003D662FCC
MTDLTIDILGWIGSLLLVTAYWLNSKNLINAQTRVYQLLNIVGSLTLMINTFYYGAYPSSSVNIIWLLMGLYHITKIFKNKQKTI